MTTKIHPTAIIESGAELDQDVSIGAYAYIGANVRIGSGSTVMHHATVDGATCMGQDNEVHPYAYIGGKTHDKKYTGGIQRLEIGKANTFREFTTVHCATSEELITRLGDHNLILAYSHIAHECQVGNHLIMSSHAALGGHVTVGDHVNIAWGSGLHQFVRIGDYAMVGASSKTVQDVPPFCICDGNPASVRTINKVGLERAGFSAEEITLVRRIFKCFYKDGLNRSQAIEQLQSSEDAEHPIARTFLEFAQSSERGLA
ncbi:MAG: acyl-ACP--UDP-N-acetylglucosamine O-acyltransferase [Coraliomargaritaceae bacterium]